MKLGDIIKYLEMLSYVEIWQDDVFLETSEREDKSELIYSGTVMDIPWYIMDYYLHNTSDYEAIGTGIYRAENSSHDQPMLSISVVEKEPSIFVTEKAREE